jgi:Holliday junction resolvase
MSEQALQKKIIDLLKSHGFDVVKIITCNRKGVSDIIACAPNGIFWAIEVKFGTNKPSPLQLHYVNEIAKRGGVAFVTWDLATVKQAIDAHLRTSSKQT